MAWEHLSINRPHLVYIILGGFTSMFMLCSLFIKEKLYIGEATVATICGIIFGPHAANLINPLEWGNPDQVTLEFSRIVLVVQCFAVGVELPRSYMERHWKSVVFLLLPVMTYGWLVTSLFIWWMIEPLTWLESLVCAACVTATDPVLASSVVGKGKFARRVPKHLRDILSAESGCNDGMAFPFIYLSVFIARYRPDAEKVAFHWFCYILLYECVFGAFYGFMVGYIARHAIKLAEKKSLIDRESFLVFYFVLALFCAGSGSLLGMDDLLIGFSAGVGFSNDGWFTEKTEESHVSNVIDLLLNLSYFVYFGTVIPWEQFHAPEHGMVSWRLVVIGVLVIFFRRIPIMLALKPILPDVKTWREALFAGHFGPIGVGAIFAAILARAELQTETTDPLAILPPPGSENYNVIYLIWPITCFLVIISIAIHGSSIAVFTLGKHINTLTLTLSYTQDNEVGRSWMDRLPRITSSNSKSLSKLDTTSFESGSNEKLAFPPGTLGPTGVRGNFLRQQKSDTEKPGSAAIRRNQRKRRWEPGKGPGGPISQSAIEPQRRSKSIPKVSPESGSDTLNETSAVSPKIRRSSFVNRDSGSSSTSPERANRDGKRQTVVVETYNEGHETIIEDAEGNVLSVSDTGVKSAEEKAGKTEQEHHKLSREDTGKPAKQKYGPSAKKEGEDIEMVAGEVTGHPYKNLKKQLGSWRGWGRQKEDEAPGEFPHPKTKPPERKRGPAHAYQFGNTIIVEDEDGEVIKTYSLPAHDNNRKSFADTQAQNWRKMSNTADLRRGLGRVGTWVGMNDEKTRLPPSADTATPFAPIEGKDRSAAQLKDSADRYEEGNDAFGDNSLRFTISHINHHGHGLSGASGTSHANGITTGSGRRYSAVDFLKEIQQIDAKAQVQAIDDRRASDQVKTETRHAAKEDGDSIFSGARRGSWQTTSTMPYIAAAGPDSVARSTGDVIILTPLSQSAQPATRRAETEGVSPGDAPQSNPTAGEGRGPVPVTETTAASTLEEGDEEEQVQEIPTHDVASTLAKFRKKGARAAEFSRHQLSTIASGSSAEGTATYVAGANRGREGDREEVEEVETAAERRRRLAALGVSQDREGSESEEEESVLKRNTGSDTATAEEDEPIRQVRQTETQVSELEPELEPELERGLKPRVQWCGVSGKETAAAKTDATEGGTVQSRIEAEGNEHEGYGAGAPKRRIKALFEKRH